MDKNNFDIEFLCVGYQKCGTTLLQEILTSNEEIYLSKRKETWFFQWKDLFSNPIMKLRKDFFNNAPNSKKLGIIDPTFIEEAKQVNDYFGQNCKIIFMVRNPVDVVYSDFKMRLRTCLDDSVNKLYRKYGYGRIQEMFEEYVRASIKEKRIRKYYFSYFIKEYFKYFDEKKIFIMFLEDLTRNAEDEMRKLEAFLKTGNYQYNLEKINTGDCVSKNYICALINKYVFKLHMKLYPLSMSWEKRKLIYDIRAKIFGITNKEYKCEMKAEVRNKLEKYFANEKRVMEKMTGRDLGRIWF
ncbi:MAG: sulfotransferase domain-containing protein [Lachnospiraceae bacterium]|jgi:hypothetical protein|nr:sulfotransferase domain-containing protein [Lachnospiraceae bacterium]